jgi:uncharacterized protein
MYLSRNTIVSAIPGSEKILLVQPLSSQVALLEAAEARLVRDTAAGGSLPASLPLEDLRQGGFVVDSDDDERRLAAEAYATYLQEIEKTETQLVVVPTFGCNLSCVYCYQEPFAYASGGLISAETIAALFAYVDRFHLGEEPRPYVTLFGGEPLVDAGANRDRVERIVAAAEERHLAVAVVTNGCAIEAYLPLLSRPSIREVQVTLDGPPPIHDRRRPLVGGAGTFDRIARGIDALVAANIPVNLRVVVDRENLATLPALAALAEARGWLDRPQAAFKTQIGRNYELFGCASRQGREQLFDRLELWTSYIALAEAHPVLRRFHQPRLHGMRHLAETGEFPVANFDGCPATKKEWAFGPDGGVYGCTATVGHAQHRLGTFAPAITRDEQAIERWRSRNVFSIPECRTCSAAPVCGGGCGAVAFQRTGEIGSPDCRPVKELLGLGARFYGLDK